MLTVQEGEEYFKLLSEYKNVFGKICKEIPGVDAKVSIYNLFIKKVFFLKSNINGVFTPS